MNNATHTATTAPDRFVIKTDRGAYFHSWDWDEGKPVATRDRLDAYDFDTSEQAHEEARLLRTLGYYAKVYRVPGKTIVTLTDEGRAYVAARRAARRHERGY